MSGLPSTQSKGATRAWGGVGAAVGALLGWSAIPFFIKHFSHEIDPWTSNGWRYGFAALVWLPVIIVGISRRTLPVSAWRSALIPAAFNSAGQASFTYSFYLLDPALVTFALRLQIVFVTIGAAMMFPIERRIISTKWYFLGLALVFGGTMLTVYLDDEFGSRATTQGVALAILSGVMFAGYGLAVRRCMRGIGSLPAFAIISLYAAVAMVALMFVFGRRAGAEAITVLTPRGFFWLLASAVIGIALGHVFYYAAMNRLGVAVTAGVIQLQPFLVGVGETIIPGFTGSLDIGQWVTGCMAIAGAAVILRVQHVKTKALQAAAAAPVINEVEVAVEQVSAPR